jgi:hypothetical protein
VLNIGEVQARHSSHILGSRCGVVYRWSLSYRYGAMPLVQAVDSASDTATVPLFAADCRDNEALAAIVAAADDVVAKVTC